jgi:hypothetical protein
MIQIGHLNLEHSGTYIVRDSVDLLINAQTIGGIFVLRVRFLVDDSRPGQISWRGENNELVVECWSWTNALGSCTPNPIQVVEHPTRTYFLDLAHHSVSDTTHLLTVHILSQEKPNAVA